MHFKRVVRRSLENYLLFPESVDDAKTLLLTNVVLIFPRYLSFKSIDMSQLVQMMLALFPRVDKL